MKSLQFGQELFKVWDNFLYCLDIKFWRSESVKSHLRLFTKCMDCVHWLILCWNIWNLHFWEDRLRLRTSCPLINSVLFFLVCNKTSWLNLVFLMWNTSFIWQWIPYCKWQDKINVCRSSHKVSVTLSTFNQNWAVYIY